ncbi:hypothetical protein AM571_CH01446 [Rhizobium etli 8C-3]|uniref:Uncharacterized protein n=1 Tax=Rhizobium etli 8C-3 TaxID=538025 RepID=A0A1L5P2F2_RHIET|nr:hypothetical protein [Rhizobium etli]APO74281.1 hypothetical protein AM571_CH01446 [Rhizobium etli 8C-3]
MMAKILMWLTIALAAVAVGLGVMLAISWGNVDKLEAEKAVIQRELDETAADLKVSTDNHNRMLSEKNRMLASERERAAAEQSAAVQSARIAKDIEYATDGTKCRDSDPMQRVLRGLWNAEHRQGAGGVDPLPDAGRSGSAAGVSGAAGGDQSRHGN